MRMFIAIIAGIVLSLAIGMSQGQVQDDDKQAGFMRAKLMHSQAVLEGLTLGDFDSIAKHSEQMRLLSLDANWQVLTTVDYIWFSREFRKATEGLTKAAKDRNLDAAVLAHFRLTQSCVNCHKYVRDHEADDEDQVAHRIRSTEKLEPYECGDVQRIHTLGGVFLASQPGREDLRTAKEGGIKTVVNLRLPEELDWDEAEFVKEVGMAYHNIPFKSPESLTDDVFKQVRALLNDPEKRPLLLHCSSANRVGAIWLAHRVLDGDIPYNEALAEAKQVGLKLPAYEERAKEHIERTKHRPEPQ